MHEHPSSTDAALAGIYSTLQQIHTHNWLLRFGGAKFLDVAQQDDMDRFINDYGKFESVGGHTASLVVSALILFQTFPALDRALNRGKVYEISAGHDLRELGEPEISAAKQADPNYVEGDRKERETKYLKQLLGTLPQNAAEYIFKTAQDYEYYGEDSLEMKFVRFLDDWQGSPFILQFLNSFSGFEEQVNKISKMRIAKWARELIDAFNNEGYPVAAKTIDILMTYHIKKFRENGVILNLEELGF